MICVGPDASVVERSRASSEHHYDVLPATPSDRPSAHQPSDAVAAEDLRSSNAGTEEPPAKSSTLPPSLSDHRHGDPDAERTFTDTSSSDVRRFNVTAVDTSNQLLPTSIAPCLDAPARKSKPRYDI